MLANPGIRVTQIAHRLDVFGSPATPYPLYPGGANCEYPGVWRSGGSTSQANDLG